MNKKKSFLIINILVCMMVVLISCGNSTTNESNNNTNEETKTEAGEATSKDEISTELEDIKPYITTTKESDYSKTNDYLIDRMQRATLSEGVSQEIAIELARLCKESVVSLVTSDYVTDNLDTKKLFLNYVDDNNKDKLNDNYFDEILKKEVESKEQVNVYDISFDKFEQVDNTIIVSFKILKDIIEDSDESKVGNLYSLDCFFQFNKEKKICNYYTDTKGVQVKINR